MDSCIILYIVLYKLFLQSKWIRVTILGNRFDFFEQHYLNVRLSRHEATAPSQIQTKLTVGVSTVNYIFAQPLLCLSFNMLPLRTLSLQHVIPSMDEVKCACTMSEMSDFLCLCLCPHIVVCIFVVSLSVSLHLSNSFLLLTGLSPSLLLLTHVVGATRKHLEFWRQPLRVPLPAAG